MRPKPNEKAKKDRLAQLVIFHINNDEFAIPIEEVQEIIKVSNITPIPDTPEFIRGIINVRGEIVTAIDLKSQFSIQEKSYIDPRHIIITRQNDTLFGILVDEVTEVLRIDEAEIKPPPNLITKIDKDHVKGVLVHANRVIVLLDLSKVLSKEEFIRLTEMVQKLHDTASEAGAAPPPSVQSL